MCFSHCSSLVSVQCMDMVRAVQWALTCTRDVILRHFTEDGSKKMLEKSSYATMHGYEAARQLSGFSFLLVVAAISSPAWYFGAIGASTACCMVAAVLYWIWSGRKESSQLVAIERELDVPTPVSGQDDDEWND